MPGAPASRNRIVPWFQMCDWCRLCDSVLVPVLVRRPCRSWQRRRRRADVVV